MSDIFDELTKEEEEEQSTEQKQEVTEEKKAKDDKTKQKKEEKTEETNMEDLLVEEPKPATQSTQQSSILDVEEKPAQVTNVQPQTRQVGLLAKKPVITLDEEQEHGKEVFVIYGDKGEGKTTLALSFPGEILALSFDRKTAPIRYNVYGNRKDIHVYDPVKLWIQTDDTTIVKTAKDVYDAVESILLQYQEKGGVDWIIFDGVEILEQIAEYVMRAHHGLTAYQGISNLNLWKERRFLMRHIHNLALNVARKGVIYTLWTTIEQIINDGEVTQQRKVPKWIDIVMFEADYVIYAYQKDGFYAEVKTSKNPGRVKIGVYNVTGKGISAITGEL